MANALYTAGKNALIKGQIAWETDVIKAALLPSSYVFDDTDTVLADVGTVIGTAQTLSTTAVSGGKATASAATFTAVASGSTVGAILVYEDAGSLIAFIDTDSGGPISVATNGGDITVTFDATNGIFTL